MKKVGIQIAVLAAVLLLMCAVFRLASGNTYTACIPFRPWMAQELDLEAEMPDVIASGVPERRGTRLLVPVEAKGPGESFLSVKADGQDDAEETLFFHVDSLMTVYDIETGGFTGDLAVMCALTVFCLAVAFIMFRHYWRTRGPAFYAYSTIYAAGFSLFALLTGLSMLNITLRHVIQPLNYTMLGVYSTLCGAGYNFMLLTSPLLLAFAVAMTISNAALMRHEGSKPKNVLGIVIGFLLVAGEIVGVLLFNRNFAGSEWEYRVQRTIENVYAMFFTYFECMLIGAIICGVKAARHIPPMDRDYLVILGCSFRKDGTLTPLLRGRVDRALAFWRSQKETTGHEAVLMPSGGQGTDEVMPEAEAMRRYLLTQGVPETLIQVEDRSRNTYQNMTCSKALIDAAGPNAKVAYVTTNYHVFRSGVWAARAGLPAEGIGSRTKWWYWPNAFMRECVGLLVNHIWQELLLLVLMIAFFGVLSLTL